MPFQCPLYGPYACNLGLPVLKEKAIKFQCPLYGPYACNTDFIATADLFDSFSVLYTDRMLVTSANRIASPQQAGFSVLYTDRMLVTCSASWQEHNAARFSVLYTDRMLVTPD